MNDKIKKDLKKLDMAITDSISDLFKRHLNEEPQTDEDNKNNLLAIASVAETLQKHFCCTAFFAIKYTLAEHPLFVMSAALEYADKIKDQFIEYAVKKNEQLEGKDE